MKKAIIAIILSALTLNLRAMEHPQVNQKNCKELVEIKTLSEISVQVKPNLSEAIIYFIDELYRSLQSRPKLQDCIKELESQKYIMMLLFNTYLSKIDDNNKIMDLFIDFINCRIDQSLKHNNILYSIGLHSFMFFFKQKNIDVNDLKIFNQSLLSYIISSDNVFALRVFSSILRKSEEIKEDSKLYLDVNIKDEYGYTPLIWLARLSALIHNDKKSQYYNIKEMAKILIFKGANIDAQNVNGNTALMCAVMNDNRELVELLIENGANINVQNVNGNTALMCAAVNDNIELIELLLKNGANINAQNVNGNTVLAYAFNDERIKQLLLERSTQN